jgi:hypothetical protein
VSPRASAPPSTVATAVASSTTTTPSKLASSSSTETSIPPGASPEYIAIKKRIERCQRFGQEPSEEDIIALRKAKFGTSKPTISAVAVVKSAGKGKDNKNKDKKKGGGSAEKSTSADSKPLTPTVSMSTIVERKRKFGSEITFDDKKKLRLERFNSGSSN